MIKDNDSVLTSLAEDSDYHLAAKFDISTMKRSDRYALKNKLKQLASEVGYTPLFVEREDALIVLHK